MHHYRLRLLSDTELLARAESVYDNASLNAKEYTLDSARFGATRASPICSICKQRVEKCIGHFSVIRLPFPIPVIIAQKDFKTLVSIICPICSHLLIDDLSIVRQIAPEARLAWVKKETMKITDNQRRMVVCPNCHSRVQTITVASDSPQYRFEIQTPSQGYADQINPIQIHTMLQNFSQIEEVGFPETYHPANFMSNFIPIVPNKLRPKTLMSAESNITTYYKNIISDICRELDSIKKQINLASAVEIPRGQIQADFNKYYDKLIAYYNLITDIGTQRSKDSEMSLINRRDRKYADQAVSLLTRLKAKHTKSLWKDGIIGTRHDKSCRTVLGGATESDVYQIQIPEHVANKLTMFYPVYAQNVDAMKQFVALMSDPKIKDNNDIPKVHFVHSGTLDRTTEVTPRNAMSKAALLRAGDKVAISLFNSDWVLECRYPSLCEEGWGSYKVWRDPNSPVLKVPFPTLAKQNADLDGDEVQAYAMASHTTDVESCVLNSIFRQFLSYKTGNCLVWWQDASKFGVNQMASTKDVNVFNGKRISTTPVKEIVSKMLPNDLNYDDGSIVIKNGKVVDKCKVNNHELFKYICYKYGTRTATDLLSKLVNFAYDVIRDNGNTLGFEISIKHKDIYDEIQKIKEQTWKRVCEIEKSNDTDYIKLIKESHELGNQKAKVQLILKEDAKDSNLEKKKNIQDVLNLLNPENIIKDRLEEYYQMVVEMDYTAIGDNRTTCTLAEGTRTCCCYPRYSIDPRAYGFHKDAYVEGIDPYDHMLDCKAAREALYIKGQGVAKQGYFSKRISVAAGNNYANWNRQVEDGFKIVSPQYGSIGADPRHNVVLPLDDISLDDKAFDSKYSEDKALIKLHKKIMENQRRYSTLTNFTQKNTFSGTFATVYHFNQFFNNLE